MGKAVRILLWILFFGLATFLVVGHATRRYISHDEQQFIVPGMFTVDQGLLPYADYPLLHTPYQVVLNGWVARHFSHRLLATRLVNAASVLVGFFLFAAIARRILRNESEWFRTSCALGVATLFLLAPVTALVDSLAWNHGMPITFSIAACGLYLLAYDGKYRTASLIFCGFCIGIAAGMRLTFLPLGLPFGLAVLCIPQRTWREKIFDVAMFGIGSFVALLPLILLFVFYPEPAFFGNFQYPKLSLVWRKYPFWSENLAGKVDPVAGILNHSDPAFAGRTLAQKFTEFGRETLVEHLGIFILALGIGLPGTVYKLVKSRGRAADALLLLLTIPFVWYGCLAPSRFNPQYYGALIPFLCLLIACGLTAIPKTTWATRVASAILVITVGVSALASWQVHREAKVALNPKQWVPSQFHEISLLLRKAVPQGKVLTLEPMVPMEADLPTYPEFGVGEFVWRSAHVVDAKRRERFHLVCPTNFQEWVAKDPPSAVLLDPHDKDLNPPLIKYAQSRGFVKMPMGPYELWVPPTQQATAD